ncbi:hypothetical protein P152DRAFT_441903 [Eremomyces bilateralis CBS 781.70]|uniref:MI domain-containing protein n=1 Tax=Eremomyces bilateralis CBS 781.70 TaxID=1392243 RepID=A0A6G1FU89_9PEZI|nr:uncharacterized protein P152DRAFT_441903 [Eremomyces bilateralis CBS 781.70]KAF1809367.1 hypothetical protein P152DRAFT_441903 [Eremomyces bilateralis CBS 781.70]
MRGSNFQGPKLPQVLLDRIDDAPQNGSGKRYAVQDRKRRRKEERRSKGSRNVRVAKKQSFPQRKRVDEDEDAFDEDEISADQPSEIQRSVPDQKHELKGLQQKVTAEIKKDETTEKPNRVHVPKAVRVQLEDDDAKIAALEKKLGLRRKKNLPKDDGLGDLLGDFSDSDIDSQPTRKRKAEYGDYLKSKRVRQDSEQDDSSGIEDTSDTNSDSPGPIDEDAMPPGKFSSADSTMWDDSAEEFGGFSGSSNEFDEDSMAIDNPPKRVKENPYKPPVQPESANGKYIPPSMRMGASDNEVSGKLTRQLKGLLNRLSESNILPIVRDVQEIYSSNPRQVVTTTLIDLILSTIQDRTALNETYLILYAGFVAAIYRLVGVEFGATLVERIVVAFDSCYDKGNASDKQTLNLMSFLSHLYSVQVVGSIVVYDFVRIFLKDLSELNTELLLRVIKSCGPQLRHEDPSSLKEIVLELHRQIARVGESNMSVRTKFMVETIGDLKNNRMKTGLGSASIAAEHLTKIKRSLAELKSQNIRASEPLRIGLNDIRNADKKGKWWLVGASWKGMGPSDGEGVQDIEPMATELDVTELSFDLRELAKQMRMNTDVRRAIFQSIMSATDYQDAHFRLLKLRLKKSQELEIPRIVVQCAVSEQSYNQYYTLIARKLCGEHRFRKAFQFICWDYLKRMGSDDEEDKLNEDGTGTLSLRELVNLGKMYGSLIGRGDEPITTLKNVDFAMLSPKAKTFVEITVVTALLEICKAHSESKQPAAVRNLFSKALEVPDMVTGLQHFIRTSVIKSDIIQSDPDSKAVRKLAQVGIRVLTETSSHGGL